MRRRNLSASVFVNSHNPPELQLPILRAANDGSAVIWQSLGHWNPSLAHAVNLPNRSTQSSVISAGVLCPTVRL
jgi:hypothetical protein